jgi:hypothetical protein
MTKSLDYQARKPGVVQHTNESLTYFQIYLDEVIQSVNAAEYSTKRQPVLPSRLLGTGLVAATVVSGLLIGDAVKEPVPSQALKTPPFKPKQRAVALVPRPVAATPEKLESPRSLSQSGAKPRVAPNQNAMDSAKVQSFAPMLPSVMLPSTPETLIVSRSLPKKRAITGTLAPAGMKPLVRPAYQDLPDLQRPSQSPLPTVNSLPSSAIRETIPTGIAPPEKISSEEPAAPISPAATISQPSRIESSPAPIPSEITDPPATDNSPTSELTAPSDLPPLNPSLSTDGESKNAIKSKLPNTAPLDPAPNKPAILSP